MVIKSKGSAYRRAGFTLVELLVVISIMSILTVITVSQFQTARKKARDVQRKSDLSSVNKALLMYFADYGKFPELAPDGIGISGAPWGGSFADTSGYVYMKVMPQENSINWPRYCYLPEAGQNPKKFALLAKMENDDDSEGGCNNTKNKTAHVASGCESSSSQKYCFAISSPNTNLGATSPIDGSGILQ